MGFSRAPNVEPTVEGKPGAGELMPQPLLAGLPLASLFLGSLADQPHAAPAEAVKRLNMQLGPAMQLVYQPANVTQPNGPGGKAGLWHAVKGDGGEFGQLHLGVPKCEDLNA